ncbi:MAG: hypothetical protein ABI721_00145 [Candidatus Dojkabacteria bacterium]
MIIEGIDKEEIDTVLYSLKQLVEDDYREIRVIHVPLENINSGLSDLFQQNDQLQAKYGFEMKKGSISNDANGFMDLVDFCRAIIASIDLMYFDEGKVQSQMKLQIANYFSGKGSAIHLTHLAREYIQTTADADLEGKIVQLALLVARKTIN